MDVGVDDIFIGNGVSELIMMAMQGLLDTGDEVLVPGPDYPLWTAAITLSGGKAVHYLCDEDSLWNPDLEDLRSKVTDRTKAIVVINPNNPTGAVYERKILEDIAQLAAERELIVFADEIYDKIIYDGATHIPWPRSIRIFLPSALMVFPRPTGPRGSALDGWSFREIKIAQGYLDGLEMLSNMRLCANVPAQYGIQTALGGTRA